jgi:hypothetical protein
MFFLWHLFYFVLLICKERKKKIDHTGALFMYARHFFFEKAYTRYDAALTRIAAVPSDPRSLKGSRQSGLNDASVAACTAQ